MITEFKFLRKLSFQFPILVKHYQKNKPSAQLWADVYFNLKFKSSQPTTLNEEAREKSSMRRPWPSLLTTSRAVWQCKRESTAVAFPGAHNDIYKAQQELTHGAS